MDFFKRHYEYLKDNPEGLWFKRKLYGWGWTPVRWQGWAVIGLFVAYMTWIIVGLPKGRNPVDAVMYLYLAKVAAGVAVLIFICYKKGEKPRWQWGLKK
ncbi:MAG: hypothetical protein NTZ36_02050 [Candidatus Jorgensenbacteria bacterium]|nr:hypothetical protein [Candidatus Jorgensenbacteria bacterium]